LQAELHVCPLLSQSVHYMSYNDGALTMHAMLTVRSINFIYFSLYVEMLLFLNLRAGNLEMLAATLANIRAARRCSPLLTCNLASV
jgi:hypothetical protein